MGRRWNVAAILLGLCVHFKIYPLVYGISLYCLAGDGWNTSSTKGLRNIASWMFAFRRLQFFVISLASFVGTSGAMWLM